ncbi:MAG TPA: M48 family metallopeptidase [Candidatus Polarisedimenticolia bacterium]|nr:M48 family metallopeptidase [Candidatus Polarisedimenticolia bacterium]
MHALRNAMTLVVATAVLAVGPVSAQTRIRPGFNIFSVEQDQEIGRQSAAEAEQQLPLLGDGPTSRYIDAIGKRLEKVAPGADYAYQFKVVNVSDINAFALPGGFLYLNRGLIEAAGSEGMLAGVMAHEMAHVALRHGTNQASKAYLGQMGLGILGGLIARDDRSTEKTVGAIGGFGLNALFLKFSRTDEEQADVVGAQILAKAGYDPMDMVAFFKMLEGKRTREPSKVEQFFSTHPTPGDRAARVRDETKMLKVRPTQPIGGFAQIKSRLQSMSPAKSMEQIARSRSEGPASSSETNASRSVADIQNIERPSTQFRTFEHSRQFFTMDYPSNWRVYQAVNGLGVTMAPDGGFVDTGGQERDLVYGVIVNHYDPLDEYDEEDTQRFPAVGGSTQGFLVGTGSGSRDRTQLARATNDLLKEILRTNPNLQLVPDSQRNDRINGAAALSLVLSGRSPATRQEERVTLFTRELPDEHVIYALFIAPAAAYNELRPTFNRMVSSLRVNDEAAHR